MSTILQLPTELLIYIFQLAISASCCSTDGSIEWGTAIRNTVHVLPGVCAQWRQRALSTRSLWSHIDVVFREPTLDGISRDTSRRLRLSLGGPIHLHFHYSTQKSPIILSHIIKLLEPHAQHISSIEFPHPSGAALLRGIFNFCVTNAPPNSLRRLTIPDTWVLLGKVPLEWPVTYLQGIIYLELGRMFRPFIPPPLDQLLLILSGSLFIHTLRL
jgi:hypothetical protein